MKVVVGIVIFIGIMIILILLYGLMKAASIADSIEQYKRQEIDDIDDNKSM